ncbi:hypothetical protein NDN08_002109 [Rhodosorus marinus]|uniref:Glucose/Sorbosone dehydrogenase domain-containing protein n=1 Tax=Rhodosorus marinus TaxID=101924 RepID=A0AAV8UWY0_9RHOD|nr:hypothetical protein NDN08_002109 [Rhodosorus marinus]
MRGGALGSFVVLFALLFGAGLAVNFNDPQFELETVDADVSSPIGTVFVRGDKEKYILLELNGVAWLYVNNVRQEEPFLNITSQIAFYGARGLKSCTFDYDFENHRYLYCSYVNKPPQGDDSSPTTGSTARFTVNNAFTKATFEKVILGTVTSSPGCLNTTLDPIEDDVICIDRNKHSMGGITMDKHGYLYVAIGDDGSSAGFIPELMVVQENGYLTGKILRVTRNGKGVPGNPWFTSGVSQEENIAKQWNLGIRNAWRFHYSEVDDVVYSINVGEASWESLYALEKGKNFGWPCTQGPIYDLPMMNYTACRDIQDGKIQAGFNSIWDYAHFFGEPAGTCIVDVMQNTNPDWPSEYSNWLFVVDYDNDWIYRLKVNSKFEMVEGPIEFANGVGSIVNMQPHPDGYVYLTSYKLNTLYRIEYVEDKSPPTVAEFVPYDGSAGVPVNQTVDVRFSLPMDSDTLDAAIELTEKASGTTVPVKISFRYEQLTAKVAPTSALKENTEYKVTVTKASSINGVEMTSKFTSTFKTNASYNIQISDMKITKSSPEGLTLDEQIGGAEISIRGIKYGKGIGFPSVPSRVRVNIPDTCNHFRTSVGVDDVAGFPMTGAMNCSVTVTKNGEPTVIYQTQDTLLRYNGEVGVVEDVNGQKLDLQCVPPSAGLSETTVGSWGSPQLFCNGYDTNPVKVVSILPTTQELPYEDPTFTITFDKQMNHKHAFDAIFIQTQSANVTATKTFNHDSTVLNVTVNPPLLPDNNYELFLNLGVRDVYGNHLDVARVRKFSIATPAPFGSTVDVTALDPVDVSGKGNHEVSSDCTVLDKAVTYDKNGNGIGVKGDTKLKFKLESCSSAIVSFGKSAAHADGRECDLQIKTSGIAARGSFNDSDLAKRKKINLKGEDSLRFVSKSSGATCVFEVESLICKGKEVSLFDLKLSSEDGKWKEDRTPDGKKLQLFFSSVEMKTCLKINRVQRNLHYQVDGKCSAVSMQVGVGAESAGNGNIRFRVEGDGETLSGKQCSLTLNKTDGSKVILCDITDKNEVVLRAGAANSSVGDEVAILGDPVFECTPNFGEPGCVLTRFPSTFTVGKELKFSGVAYGSAGKELPETSVTWFINRLHCTHGDCTNRAEATIANTLEGSWVVDNYQDFSRIEIECRVRDNGVSASSTVVVEPKTVEVDVDTEPSGLPVSFGGKVGRSTPFTERVVIGTTLGFGGPEELSFGGTELKFRKWLDDSSEPAFRMLKFTEDSETSFVARYK